MAKNKILAENIKKYRKEKHITQNSLLPLLEKLKALCKNTKLEK